MMSWSPSVLAGILPHKSAEAGPLYLNTLLEANLNKQAEARKILKRWRQPPMSEWNGCGVEWSGFSCPPAGLNPNPNPNTMFYAADGAEEKHGFVNARTITHA